MISAVELRAVLGADAGLQARIDSIYAAASARIKRYAKNAPTEVKTEATGAVCGAGSIRATAQARNVFPDRWQEGPPDQRVPRVSADPERKVCYRPGASRARAQRCFRDALAVADVPSVEHRSSYTDAGSDRDSRERERRRCAYQRWRPRRLNRAPRCTRRRWRAVRLAGRRLSQRRSQPRGVGRSRRSWSGTGKRSISLTRTRRRAWRLRRSVIGDVHGGPDVASWFYRCAMAGPSATAWRTRSAGGVLHLRWLVDPARPWAGVSPLSHAADTSSLIGWLDKRLAEEASGPVGAFLPVAKYDPDADADLDADPDADPLGQLRHATSAARRAKRC